MAKIVETNMGHILVPQKLCEDVCYSVGTSRCSVRLCDYKVVIIIRLSGQFRKRFYKVSAWLGTYFPIRLLVSALVHFYPRPINSLVLECVIAVLYLMTATLITLEIEKHHLPKN